MKLMSSPGYPFSKYPCLPALYAPAGGTWVTPALQIYKKAVDERYFPKGALSVSLELAAQDRERKAEEERRRVEAEASALEAKRQARRGRRKAKRAQRAAAAATASIDVDVDAERSGEAEHEELDAAND